VVSHAVQGVCAQKEGRGALDFNNEGILARVGEGSLPRVRHSLVRPEIHDSLGHVLLVQAQGVGGEVVDPVGRLAGQAGFEEDTDAAKTSPNPHIHVNKTVLMRKRS
jgi:hypothetical protein